MAGGYGSAGSKGLLLGARDCCWEHGIVAGSTCLLVILLATDNSLIKDAVLN